MRLLQVTVNSQSSFFNQSAIHRAGSINAKLPTVECSILLVSCYGLTRLVNCGTEDNYNCEHVLPVQLMNEYCEGGIWKIVNIPHQLQLNMLIVIFQATVFMSPMSVFQIHGVHCHWSPHQGARQLPAAFQQVDPHARKSSAILSSPILCLASVKLHE